MGQEENEQFSLRWDNFNQNLSAGFNESLDRGDFSDVTLAAEGQFIQAHRLLLSVGSPFFQRMFKLMPSNQHAFGKSNFSLFTFLRFHQNLDKNLHPRSYFY